MMTGAVLVKVCVTGWRIVRATVVNFGLSFFLCFFPFAATAISPQGAWLVLPGELRAVTGMASVTMSMSMMMRVNMGPPDGCRSMIISRVYGGGTVPHGTAHAMPPGQEP